MTVMRVGKLVRFRRELLSLSGSPIFQFSGEIKEIIEREIVQDVWRTYYHVEGDDGEWILARADELKEVRKRRRKDVARVDSSEEEW